MATFTKLRSGEWGIKVQGTAKAGQQVTVTKKSGGTKQVTIAKVVWSGNGVAICAIENRKSNGYVPARRDSRGYCGYPCPVTGRECCPANGPCHDCE